MRREEWFDDDDDGGSRRRALGRRTVKCSPEPKKQGGGKSGLVGRQGGEIEGDEKKGGRPLRLAGRRCSSVDLAGDCKGGGEELG